MKSISIPAFVGTAISVAVYLFNKGNKTFIIVESDEHSPFVTMKHLFQNDLFFHTASKKIALRRDINLI